MESLDTIKQIIDIFTALLSPVIAISVGFIAYQQWKLNVDKENRENNSNKLKIYMVVKRFLRNVDENLMVDKKLYAELQESIALADFYFEVSLHDWLFEVDEVASSWLNLTEINSQLNSENLSSEFTRNQEEIDKLIGRLQTYHCELFGVFKDSMMYLK